MKGNRNTFLHIIMGTKGEFVKMAPIIKELDNRGIDFNLIYTNQHTQLIEELSKVFDIRYPNFYLHHRIDDIMQMKQIPFWYLTCILKSCFFRQQLWQRHDGICLLHGDTPSTLLGLIIGRIHNLRIAHVESGLRSYNLLNPFPEEIIRILTTRFADFLFAPSQWAAYNLKKGIIRGQIVNTEGNTVFDAIEYVLKKDVDLELPASNYVVAAIHRIETLYMKERCALVVEALKKISIKLHVIFIAYKPTVSRLIKYGLMHQIGQNQNISVSPYYDYASFIKLIKNATFVITDGGGLQEETYYLNIPCLLMRKKTERQEGLESTCYLCDFSMQNVNYFLENYKSFRRTSNSIRTNASKVIVDTLMTS